MPHVATRADAVRVCGLGTTDEVLCLHAVGTVEGVVPLAVATQNGPGTGHLRATQGGSWLSWRAPGSATYGTAVHCGEDGSYLLEDGEDLDQWIRVQVVAAQLPSAATDAVVYLARRFTFGDMLVDEEEDASPMGDLDLYNASSGPVFNVRVWLADGTTNVEISKDGLNWSSPTTEETGLSWSSIDPDGSGALWVKRSAGVDSDPDVLKTLHIAWDCS